jgi:glycosyltransferase involved in cell wall biosynthesis
MRIALFDYIVTADNAIGKCDLAILAGLCDEVEFTVFSARFENPRPDRIRWVRVPAARRPLVLLCIVFHLLAPLCYLWHCIRHRVRFDLVQVVESNLLFGDISYSHFCHRAFLERHWKGMGARGLRGIVRWLDHLMHALFEPWVYRRATLIVAPSHGLRRELSGAYPQAGEKIRVLANPVDIDRLRPPAEFDRRAVREEFGWSVGDIVFAFVALGHFDRKGLPLFLAALETTAARDPRLKAVVVGGSRVAIAPYLERAVQGMLNGNVKFVETQQDVRPYLWAADALMLPSHYEVFPLVALEAAAAGLPLLVTPLYGVEEFLRDGENGLLMERNAAGVSGGIEQIAGMSAEARRTMGLRAQSDVTRYGLAEFVAGWSKLYSEAAAHAG